MNRHLACVSILVDDYDTAIAHYTRDLRFVLIEDTPQGPDKRWVLVAPSAEATTRLLLARAATPKQRAQIGQQCGGRVFLFLYTDDFARDHAHMLAHGVRFAEAPRHEPYGTVAVFTDKYGNRWDLLQPSAAT